MDKETPDTSLMQSRLSKISEIANVLRGCDELIDALSERFQWDKKLSLAEVTPTNLYLEYNDLQVSPIELQRSLLVE